MERYSAVIKYSFILKEKTLVLNMLGALRLVLATRLGSTEMRGSGLYLTVQSGNKKRFCA